MHLVLYSEHSLYFVYILIEGGFLANLFLCLLSLLGRCISCFRCVGLRVPRAMAYLLRRPLFVELSWVLPLILLHRWCDFVFHEIVQALS